MMKILVFAFLLAFALWGAVWGELVSTNIDEMLDDVRGGDGTELVRGMQSDYFRVYTQPSSISGISGVGVFARMPIQQGSIICEYRGPIVLSEHSNKVKSDKKMTMSYQGKSYTVIGQGVCALINDCRDIANAENKTCHQGYSHNAKSYQDQLSGKLFVMASRYIHTGEEIFFDYDGTNSVYW